MQSSDFEKLVEAYLLNDRHTLVAPQYLIRVNGRDRWPDVLAVRPREKTFYLVEVTENRNPKVLTQKLSDYQVAASQIADNLAKEFSFDGTWKAKPWIFVRRDACSAFETALKQQGVHCEISLIEQLIDRPASEQRPDRLDPNIWGQPNKAKLVTAD